MTQAWKTLAIALCLVCPGLGIAADENPDEEAAHIRHALMELMGWNMKTVAAMSTDKQPYNQAQAEIHGQRLAALAGMISDAFARDTSGSDVKTEALDAIWLNQTEFEMNAVKLGEAASNYAAATAENEAAAKKAFVTLGGSCKGCHEEFKAE